VELTRQADYAMRCVLEVARHDRIGAAEIAARQQLSPSFVGKIVSALARAGILETMRGATGGVRLGRPPEAISLVDILEAVEGPIRLNRCVREPPGCAIVDACPLSPVFRDAQAALVGALSVSIADLASRERHLRPAGAAGPRSA
jgi:Rrf2 family protein